MTTGKGEKMFGIDFEVARVTIEFRSAFAVGTGEGDGRHDAVFATDANGLPAIPGDSIAGVLRHALEANNDDDDARNARRCAAFGFQDRDAGQASAVRVSWAQAHGQDNRPVPFRGAKLDTVTEFLAAGVMRDHVRIGLNGVAEPRGKFDEILVPAGARFTFELTLDHAFDHGVSVTELLDLLRSPSVRLGHGTRHGLGEFDVVEARSRRFDLRNPTDRADWAKYPVRLDHVDHQLRPVKLADAKKGISGWVEGEVVLEPLDTWVVGGSLPTQSGASTDDTTANLARFPLAERRIVWDGSKGKVQDDDRADWLVPGAALKGALRHRTAFHLRRLEKRWYPVDHNAASYGEAARECENERELFGSINATHDSGDNGGSPAQVMVDDAWVARSHASVKPMRLQHVSLDRFTQGPMDHMLFGEDVLLGGKIVMRIAVARSVANGVCRVALRAALDDLGRGRLGIGAGRGHGRMKKVSETWSDSNWFVSED